MQLTPFSFAMVIILTIIHLNVYARLAYPPTSRLASELVARTLGVYWQPCPSRLARRMRNTIV